ncbi:TATA box-binding protein-associated factor RNA polymerase I subunit C [Colossoma macropomum]|uniref:TATA box-binding protein-associated factor RNA polymerase I subunit C n=1 Tax=Colossoma macropomum TaxID=42526 RepID=UPI001863F119|nr:TATA box-binding protein-associated factor RNA polymerase I subunit C [Colossoma macropomum]
MSGLVSVAGGSMDNKFPAQLFPHFYLDGPPDLKPLHLYGGWGSYGQVLRAISKTAQTPWEFQAQHVAEGEMWVPVEPVVTPLLPPNAAAKIFSGPPVSPDDFPEHMQHFYVHHCKDSFFTMGQLLGEHFNFGRKWCKDRIKMGRMHKFVDCLKYKKCELEHTLERVPRYHNLLKDVVCDIPSALLAELLHEELTLQKDLEEFQPSTTGGALGYFPLEDFEGQKEACLVYPRGEALDSLNFHRVVLEFNDGKPPFMNMENAPLVFKLNGSVRQISTARVDDEATIGVRLDHFCGVWMMKDGQRPRPLQVIQLEECCTSISVSPHVRAELVVATESGAAYHWTVGSRPQKFRDERSNLYFNAKSLWRWCEFSAHPRVMVFADRTGAELTDSRSSDCSHTLFRIGKTAGCKSGERVFLAKYLGQGHAHHHLIATQFSAYVMDERMPSVPALKWEHMMESPPCFAQIVPALDSKGTSKILLGAQKAQETMLLQYSGGREEPCRAHGPVQKLCSPCESLTIRQLPHRQHKVKERLAVPAAGLAAAQNEGFLSVFQLTGAGDIFCQMLKLHSDTHPEPSRNIDSVESLSNLNSQSTQVSEGQEESAEETKKEGKEQEVSDSELFSDSDSEREQYQQRLSQVEVVVNDERDSHASDAEEGISREPSSVPDSSMRSAQINSARPVRPASPETASKELKLIWKKWLASLLVEATAKEHCLEHWQLRTRDMMRFKVKYRDRLEEDQFLSLRKDLTDAMKNRQLLIHKGTYLPPLEVAPLPEAVDPSDWPDDLSQRLTASWGGDWSNWWDEKLGLNRDTKIEALRRKRRQEKRAKARNRVALSGSFTSSVSYQDDLSGWSSGTSQYLGSDGESFVNSQSAAEDTALSEPETLPKSPVTQRRPTSQATERSSPESFKSLRSSPSKPQEQDSAMVISQSQNQEQGQAPTVETDSLFSSSKTALKPSLSSQQKPKLWQQQDYLSSLFGSQEPSQDPGQVDDGSLPVHSAAAMSQRLGSSYSLRRPSQPRASSQASQPQRKKSRMGF